MTEEARKASFFVSVFYLRGVGNSVMGRSKMGGCFSSGLTDDHSLSKKPCCSS